MFDGMMDTTEPLSEGAKYHEQQCTASPVAVPAPTEPSEATELPELDVTDEERASSVVANLCGTGLRLDICHHELRAQHAILLCRERQLRDYKAKYEAALRETERVEAALATYSEALKFHMDRCDALLREIAELRAKPLEERCDEDITNR